jgi:hypothetical protein
MTHPDQPQPRPPFPDERWTECVREEKAYTDGWREGIAGVTTGRAARHTVIVDAPLRCPIGREKLPERPAAPVAPAGGDVGGGEG